jgi:hypothetical protein
MWLGRGILIGRLVAPLAAERSRWADQGLSVSSMSGLRFTLMNEE